MNIRRLDNVFKVHDFHGYGNLKSTLMTLHLLIGFSANAHHLNLLLQHADFWLLIFSAPKFCEV